MSGVASGSSPCALDRHTCLIFESNREAVALCIAQRPQGTRAAEEWLLVSNGEQAPGAGKIAAPLAPVRVIAAESLAMRELTVSVTSIIDAVRRLVEVTLERAQRTIVLVMDMSWLLHTPSGIAHMGEFEASLHQLIAENGSALRAMCLYNRKFFPESLLLDVLRTHPSVGSTRGPLCNPHFLPPQAYLSGDPGAQLDSWTATLGPVVPSDAGEASWPSSACEPSPPAASAAHVGKVARATRARRTALDDVPRSHGKPADTPAQQRWKIRCFGNLRIYRQDGSPVRWDRIHGATVKTKTLFALLLSRAGKGASAEEIADLLWPDASSMVQSLNRLYHTVHCLRAALDPAWTASHGSAHLACREHRYYLTLPEGTWIDVPVFEEFCRQGEQLLKADQLEESLVCHRVAEKLYRGPLYSDIPPKYAENADINWCWSQRYWLQETYVKMVTYTAQILRRLGDAEQAVLYAEKALAVDPCFEPAHRESMRAFHVANRRDALDRQYRLCGEVLKRYEARSLSTETRLLYQDLVGCSEETR